MSNKYDLIKLDIDKNSWINGIAARSEKKPQNKKTTKIKTPNKKTRQTFQKSENSFTFQSCSRNTSASIFNTNAKKV